MTLATRMERLKKRRQTRLQVRLATKSTLIKETLTRVRADAAAAVERGSTFEVSDTERFSETDPGAPGGDGTPAPVTETSPAVPGGDVASGSSSEAQDPRPPASVPQST